MKNRIIPVIVGPTAVGKTECAIRIAQELDGEIVSADSMQIYRFMDIGSAKPTAEEQAAARHHLVDTIDPREPFSVAEYCRMARECIEDIFRRGKLPVISGGTGLYVNSLIYDMDFSAPPADRNLREKYQTIAQEKGAEYLHSLLAKVDSEAAARIHPNNVKKVIRAMEAAKSGEKIPSFENSFRRTSSYTCILIGLQRDRAELYDRINRRVDIMMEAGLEDEIRRLMDMGLSSEDISMKGIGYKELIDAMNGFSTTEEAVELIKRNSRRYAKRQMTWFRRYPDIRWFDLTENRENMENADATEENRDVTEQILTYIREKSAETAAEAEKAQI